MRMNRLADIDCIGAHFHRECDFGDEIAGVRADDAAADHPVSRFIEQQFGEAFVASVGDGASRCCLFLSPQLVFVGDPRTPSRLAAPIYGFRSREEANYVLWRQRFRLRAQPFRFFVFDEMPGADSRAWPARPTNGAIMVATAAALRPLHLVIAGIDLYSHPAGRYPGGSDAHDGYNRVHDRDVEIEMIRQALAGFAGELVLLSPILAAALGAGDGISRAARVPS